MPSRVSFASPETSREMSPRFRSWLCFSARCATLTFPRLLVMTGLCSMYSSETSSRASTSLVSAIGTTRKSSLRSAVVNVLLLLHCRSISRSSLTLEHTSGLRRSRSAARRQLPAQDRAAGRADEHPAQHLPHGTLWHRQKRVLEEPNGANSEQSRLE